MVVWLVLSIVVGSALTFAYMLWRGREVEGVRFVGFSAESTETVSFAGLFPEDPREAMANPLAMEQSGGLLYIADSDAGAIRVFTVTGIDRGSISVPAPEGLGSAYPVDIAVVDERSIAVVDTAGERVVMIWADAQREDTLISVLGSDDPTNAPIAPTAVAVWDGRVLVADAERRSIMRYDMDGTWIDEIAADLTPPLTFVGAITPSDKGVYVSDASGRVVVLDPESGEQTGVLGRLMELPRGAGVDDLGRVYVTDRFAAMVEVFDSEFEHAERFGNGQRTEYALKMPVDAVWFGEDKRLYVLDALAGRVVAYNMRQLPE